LRTRAIPERLRGVFTTRRYTNPRLPFLTLLSCCRQGGREQKESSSAAEADCRSETEPRVGASAAARDDCSPQRPVAGDEGKDVDGRQVCQEGVRCQCGADAEEMHDEREGSAQRDRGTK